MQHNEYYYDMVTNGEFSGDSLEDMKELCLRVAVEAPYDSNRGRLAVIVWEFFQQVGFAYDPKDMELRAAEIMSEVKMWGNNGWN